MRGVRGEGCAGAGARVIYRRRCGKQNLILVDQLSRLLYIAVMTYEQFLQVNRTAQVYVLDGEVYSRFGRRIAKRNGIGYLTCTLQNKKDQPRKIESAHRIVWFLTHGDIPAHLVINHKNGIKSDNRIANLELVTTQENMQHAYKAGLVVAAAGSATPTAKLTVNDVQEIRQLLADRTHQQKEIARLYGVDPATVSNIKLGKAYKNE